jgi:hypothetical protein
MTQLRDGLLPIEAKDDVGLSGVLRKRVLLNLRWRGQRPIRLALLRVFSLPPTLGYRSRETYSYQPINPSRSGWK